MNQKHEGIIDKVMTMENVFKFREQWEVLNKQTTDGMEMPPGQYVTFRLKELLKEEIAKELEHEAGRYQDVNLTINYHRMVRKLKFYINGGTYGEWQD